MGRVGDDRISLYALSIVALGILIVYVWLRSIVAFGGGGGKRLSVSDYVSLGDLSVTPDVTSAFSSAFVSTPTSASASTPTPTPTSTPTSTPAPASRLVRVVTYWPDAGDDWCALWRDDAGHCVSAMTSGADWRALDGQALACDPQFLGHVLHIPALGIRLPCLDTGQSFVCGWRECSVGLLSSDHGRSLGLHEALIY